MTLIQFIALISALFLILGALIPLAGCLASAAINIRYGQLRLAASRAGKSYIFLILRTMVSSFPGFIFSFVTSLLPAGHGLHSTPGSHPDQRLIVCIHGLYHNRRAWFFYRRWLRQAGFSNFFTWSYPSFGPDFHALSRDLTRDLRRLAQTHPQGTIVLIGHSMGGLLIKSTLHHPDISERIGLVVSLATPHQGSVLAGLALGKLGRSLQYGSDLVCSQAQPDSRLGPVKVNIHSPLDNMVAPASALQPLEAGWKEILTPPLGHVSLLFHRPTARLVGKLIASDKLIGSRFQVPGSPG